MKLLIPARVNSSRCPDKNWKPFLREGLSLFDVKARQLLAAFAPGDVYVSCENESKRTIVEEYGFNFLPRDPFLCTKEGERFLFRVVSDQVPGTDDLCLISLTDPFFSEFGALQLAWEEAKDTHDSLMVVRRCTDQILDENGQPKNFEFFGQPTQFLKKWYTISMCALVSKRETIRACGHYIGRNPARLVTEAPCVDIDTPAQFALAGALYCALYGAFAYTNYPD